MSTRLVLHIQDPEGDSSMTVEVREDFDKVMNNICPPTPPGSGLEFQQACIYHQVEGGGRVMIHPQRIEVAEELMPDGE